MYIINLLLIACLFTNPAPEPKPNSAAIALNKKAIELATRRTAEANRKDVALKVLKLLDSATSLDPKYYNAYLNKTGSLLELNRTQDALANLYHIIQMEPGQMVAYTRAGHIIEYIKGSKEKAMPYYKKAYQISLATFKKEGRKNFQNDLNIAYSLAFYKSRPASAAYLKSIEKYYLEDETSMRYIQTFQNLLEVPFTFEAVKNSLSTYLP